MGYQTVNTSSKVRSYIELQRDAKLAPSSHQAGMCQLWLTLLLATNIARPTHTLALRLLGWLSSHVYGFFVRRHCDFQRWRVEEVEESAIRMIYITAHLYSRLN